MNNTHKIILSLILWMTIFPVKAQQLAFPGAEGYGKYSTGGRGGRVIEVTNLKDLGSNGLPEAGSFRAALATPGTDPITIVFRVAGTIALSNKVLKCSRPNMTIAGQTAPGDGICISNQKIYFSGNNIVIRYMRFRVGDLYKISFSCLDIENCKHAIVDHCSLSWSVEENMDNYDTKYTTVQWCMVSEGLYNSYNGKGARAYGAQWGGQYASYHHNVVAHCHSRSPRINGCRAHDTLALTDFRNNVIFNWGVSGAIYGGELGLNVVRNGKQVSACLTNFINNYYKPGPGTSDNYFAAPYSGTHGYGKWYFSGNYMYGNSARTNDNWSGVKGLPDSCRSSSPFSENDQFNNNIGYNFGTIRTQTALDAYRSVLDSAGAILPSRDAVDRRIVAQIEGHARIGGGATLPGSGMIDSPSDVGAWPYLVKYTPLTDTDHDGMPDDWEKAKGLNPNDASDRNSTSLSGTYYTNLEVYLNSISSVQGVQVKTRKIVTKDTLRIAMTLDASSQTYGPRTVTLSKKFYPSAASDTTSYWSIRVADKNIASIDSVSGKLTLTGLGDVVATVHAIDRSGITGSVKVTAFKNSITGMLDVKKAK